MSTKDGSKKDEEKGGDDSSDSTDYQPANR